MDFRSEKKLIECSQKLCHLYEYGDLTEISLTIFSLLKSSKCGEDIKLAECLVDILSKQNILTLELLQIVSEFETTI